MRSPQRRGFALLITITLVAFLVLVVVGLATLTRVETRVASNGRQLSQARQNALFALDLALGRLQQFAGPDKASTARADITSPGVLPQPYLTGVWTSTNATTVPDIWLVSGNETSPVATTPAGAPDPATGAEPVEDGVPGRVFLVGSNTVDSAAQRVLIDKQPITSAAGTIPGLASAATVGHYAWWVGDSGVKASASLTNPLLGANPIAYDNTDGTGSGLGEDWSDSTVRKRLDQMQLTRPRVEHVLATLAPDGSDISLLPRVDTLQQLGLTSTPPAATAVKAQFHNLAPLNRGVLADTSAGRLRQDLSDTTASTDPAVQAMQRFLQTRTKPAGSSGPFDTYYEPVAALDPGATTFPAYSLGPVLSEVGVRLNFYLNSTDNKVHYAYVIDAELWNPYAAHLRLPSAKPLTVEISGLPVFTVKTDGATDTTVTLPDPLVATFDSSVTDVGNPAAPWKEGRIRVFRGTGTLRQVSPATSPPAVLTIVDDIVPGATDDPAATTVTVTYPATTTFTAVLKVDGDILATYAPHNLAGTGLQYNAGTSSGGVAPASTGWIAGYGYEFADDTAGFTADTATGAGGGPGALAAVDPRLPVMNGAFYNNGSGIWNAGKPANNTAGTGTANTFSTGSVNVFFDLPRQEVVSLGMLTHVIGAQSYFVGNARGGTANAVFDRYHISTVPRYATAWTPDGDLPLPNRYVEIYRPEAVPAGTLADLRSGDDSARYLLQSGAFNINSTSVEAWTAVLGSKLAAWRYTINTLGSTGSINLDNAYFRLPHGAQQIIRPPLINGVTSGPTARNSNSPNNTSGRQLTDAEVTDLASAIVTGIRARGRPFATLQEFVNSGVIQTAINATTINSLIPGAFSAARLNTPGALIQSDVIDAIAPFMAARSDTFVIRTYGDAQNPVTGAVEGRAWCEATVQRVPDLIADPTAPTTDVISPDPAAHPFGRAFKIISFRWLTSSDI